MADYRYILEKYSGLKSRHTCPACGKKKIFVRYIDSYSEGAPYLSEDVGRCDREVSCGYHYTPKMYFAANFSPGSKEKPNYAQFVPAKDVIHPSVDIPHSILEQTLSRPGISIFAKWLHTIFDKDIVKTVCYKYRIGTSSNPHWWNCKTDESVTFPFINKSGCIRYIQVKLFRPDGHTAKYIDSRKDNDLSSCTTGIHTVLKCLYKRLNRELPQWLEDYPKQDGKKIDCFFGEHLLSIPEYAALPIAILEAPKGAIVASVFFPQYTWLAVGALSYLTPERCEVLRGKRVILFPDLGAFEKWSARASELKHLAKFSVSDILERIATPQQRAAGLDLCDYMVSDEVRQELIEEFKSALIKNNDDCDAAQWQIWEHYRDRGLRLRDRIAACNELINQGIFQAPEIELQTI